MAKKQKFPHLVNSKWTSCQEMWGWRHFHVTNRKNQKKWVFAEMVAACDDTVRFWINAKSLKDKTLWLPGWQSLNFHNEGTFEAQGKPIERKERKENKESKGNTEQS